MVVPKKVMVYDKACDIHYRQLSLTMEELNGFYNCQDEMCMAGLLAVPVVSAFVSGSIVVVGNVVYWLEKEGRCLLSQSGTNQN